MYRARLGIMALTSALALGSVAPSALAWDDERERPRHRVEQSRDRERDDDRHERRDDRQRDARARQEHDRDRDHGPRQEPRRHAHAPEPRRSHDRPPPQRHWARGQRYQGPVYVVGDYHRHHLRRPPHGHRWQRDDAGNLLLVAIATGIIADIVRQN